ncbi:hypothetical protein HPS_0497 [Glaesserella parasuis 29755]|nr:hypothetical protein HPSNAG_0533 [Glaesserella parasuis str. Nagasaki]EQA09997.1 hypothetical protein HPS8415995_0588 [Glaesserella parasuis 84-15995]EQA95981.1 hypothetical protein HPS_0497 [Glaesserella parasuis 29755]
MVVGVDLGVTKSDRSRLGLNNIYLRNRDLFYLFKPSKMFGYFC